MANIVIVDDDRQFLRVIRRSLQMAGHAVTIYEDGSAAIAHIGREIPDLLITDIFMPGMEGLETTRMARAISSKLPIIAISGGSFAGPDYLAMVRIFGATASLAKPFRPAELVQLVSQLLQPGTS